MSSRNEVEVKLTSAKDIKNVNWRNGPTRPYAVLWVDPDRKCSSRSDDHNDTNPVWDETIVIPLPSPINDDTTLYIDVVHAGSEPDTKRLIGSARLRLSEVLGADGAAKTLQLKRPSGRPHGKIDVKVSVRDPYNHRPPPDPYAAPPYYSSGAPPPQHGGYPYNPYGGQPGYGGQPAYGGGQAVYGHGEGEKKGSKFGGMGTGLAVGAAAGVLGGLALAEGADYVEDQIADDVADKVEDDLGYDDADDF